MRAAAGGKWGDLRRLLPGGRLQAIFWLTAVAGAIADLWSKHAVFAWMRGQGLQRRDLIEGLLAVVVAENPGAAFSIAEGQTVLLIVFSAAAIAGVVGWFLFSGGATKLISTAMGMFLGGVIGNLYDRVFNDGKVRDFVDVYYGRYSWPAFNVADCLLVVGVGLLILASVRARPSQRPADRRK